MDDRNGRRGNRWLEIIHTREVSSLARRYDISLDGKLVRFLEEYSEIVLHVTNKQKERRSNQDRLHQELEDVNKVVQDEVSATRRALFHENAEAERHFFTVRHQETYLPIVHFAIRGLPELLVHVPRTYATRKKGISFGLLSMSNKGVLSGAIARAANYLRHRCRDMHWDLSVSDVVNLWYQQALHIPPEERMSYSKSASPKPRRRGSVRRRTRSKIDVHRSQATAEGEDKARKMKRFLVEGENEGNSNQPPTKRQKLKHTEAPDVYQTQEVATTSALTGERGAEHGGGQDDRDKEKALKPLVAASMEEAHPADNIIPIGTKAARVGENTSQQRNETHEMSDLESLRQITRQKEDSNRDPKPETRSKCDAGTLEPTANKEVQEPKQKCGKLEVSAFLTPNSMARHFSQCGEFKQVDIDEGFDTIGGLGDNESEDSNDGSADHSGEYAEPRQQICFEQVDMDHGDGRRDCGDGGGNEEGTKIVVTDGLSLGPNEKQFISFRFADALSAVNLAGNDDIAPYVKREDEVQ
ncbi:unnamed protein product [Agarophyton chilense]|eukprot:gb/GEZJ01005077.1/.p1 GENE.gb/GEZJ01005077.1/~~gb/GEZJ01005077.1/.p1  ORF type:complete len:527 (-),score=74.05 gb/GEZJ01005077.1/:527-2107(-)